MSKRERRRYLALAIKTQHTFQEREIVYAVRNALIELFGEYGVSRANLKFMEIDLTKSFAIVRCSHTALEKVRASVASITAINGKPVVLHSIAVSGTLQALRKRVISKETSPA